MGLVLSVKGSAYKDSPSWSYGGFDRFRSRLAGLIGLTLDEMEGHGGETKWPSGTTDPIIYLLNHSDCEGIIGPSRCKIIAPRLAELLNKIAFDPDNEDDDYDIFHGRMLVKQMLKAAETGKPLEFH